MASKRSKTRNAKPEPEPTLSSSTSSSSSSSPVQHELVFSKDIELPSVYSSSLKDIWLVLLPHSILTVAALSFLPLDVAVVLSVIAFNILVPIVAIVRNLPQWLDLWWYSFVLSVTMVIPDWVLSKILHSIQFAPSSFVYHIDGHIPVFMAGMWAIPVFFGMLGALSVRERHGYTAGLLASLGTSLIIIGSETPSWYVGIWKATQVTEVLGHTALYVIVPELLFGIFTYHGFTQTRGGGFTSQIFAAFNVMLHYTGALVVSYLLLETTIKI